MTFDEALVVTNEPPADFVALDDALKALATFDERKSRVIELRYFGGLSVEETAVVLKVSPSTVMGDWRLAKAWLQREMGVGRVHDGVDGLVRDVAFDDFDRHIRYGAHKIPLAPAGRP